MRRFQEPYGTLPLRKADQYDFLLTEGLLGGSVTTAWCMLHGPTERARLQYDGLKKVDGVQLHQVRYYSRLGAEDMKVFLHFEPETFRHVKSRCVLEVRPFVTKDLDQSAWQRDTYWRLQEDYGDFREVDGLSVPHFYKLVLTYEGQTQTSRTEWNVSLSRVRHNQTLDPATFLVQ